MDFTHEDIIREFERLFPLEFRVAMLTLTNRRQTDLIHSQSEQIARFRENAEFWENDPNRDGPDPGKK